MVKIFDYERKQVREVSNDEATQLVTRGAAAYQNDPAPGRDADNPPTDPASNE